VGLAVFTLDYILPSLQHFEHKVSSEDRIPAYRWKRHSFRSEVPVVAIGAAQTHRNKTTLASSQRLTIP
jgi:hypothetical protein